MADGRDAKGSYAEMSAAELLDEVARLEEEGEEAKRRAERLQVQLERLDDAPESLAGPGGADFDPDDSTRKAKYLAESTSDWLWVLDADLRFTYISDRFTGGIGIDPAVFLGKTRWEASTTRQDSDIWPAHRADLEARRQIRNFRYAFETPAGERRYVSLNGDPVFDAAGRFTGYRGTARDVTAEVEAQQALEDRERRLAHAARLVKLGYWVWDLKADRAVHISEEMARICGLSSEEEALVAFSSGPAADAWLHPEDLERVLRAEDEAVETGRGYELEYRILRRDGEIRHVRLIGEPLCNEAGEVVQLSGTVQDITEQRKSEAALHRSEERFHLALSGANDGLWDWDLAAGQVYYSPRLLEITGYPPDQEFIPQEKVVDGIHADDRARYEETLRAHLRGETDLFECEMRVIGRDGKVRWVLDRGRALRDGRGRTLRMAGSVIDVTARHEAQEALRESEARLAHATRMAKLGYLSWDELRDRPIYASEEYLRILGFSSEAEFYERIKSRKELHDTYFHPEDREGSGAAIRQAVVEGRDADLEFRVLLPNGEFRHVRAVSERVLDEQGRVVRTNATVQDISDLKVAEAGLRENEARLAHATRMSKVGYLVWDEENDRPIYVSEEYVRMLGLGSEGEFFERFNSRKELHKACFHPEDRARCRAEIGQSIAEGREMNLEYRMLLPDGEVRHVRAVAERVANAQGRTIRSHATVQDITDLRRAEAALRENEARLAHAARMAKVGYMTWDEVNDKPVYASEEYVRILGLQSEAEFLERFKSRKELHDAWFHPEEYSRHHAGITQAIAEGRDSDLEFRRLRPDGEIQHIHAVAERVLDAQGRTLRTHVTIQDITDLRRAEAALRENEARLAHAAEIARLGYWAWDEVEDRPLFASREFLRIYGLESEAGFLERFQSKRAFHETFFHPEDRAALAADVRRAIEEGRNSEFEYRVVRADGEIRYVRAVAERVFDRQGRVVRSNGIILDITEAKWARDELDRLRGLLLAAIEQTPAGIIIADAPDVNIRIANSAALGIRGSGAETLTDIPAELHPANWQTFHPDGSPFFPEDLPLSQAVLYGKTSRNVDVIIRRPDGEDRWVLGNAAPVRDREGKIIAGIVVFPDVTEQKRIEAALRENEARFRAVFESTLR